MKIKSRNILLFSFEIVILLVIIILVIMIHFSPSSLIVGQWVSFGGTKYIFQSNGKGIMKSSVNNSSFSYFIDKDSLVIDFDDDNLFDPRYEYQIHKRQLILKGERGTFLFTKD